MKATGKATMSRTDTASATGSMIEPPGSSEPHATDFAAVVDRYESPLLRYVAHILGGRNAEVEDVVQETFLRLHRTVIRKGPESILCLSTWLFRVAHNLAIDSGRKKTRRREQVSDEATTLASDQQSTEVSIDAISAMVRREACEMAMKELTSLPDVQRQAILLKVVQGMTMKQIGQVLGMAPSNACYHINQGLAALARRLKSKNVL